MNQTSRRWPWFTSPAFDAEEATQRERVFHIVAWSTMAIVTPLLAGLALLQPDIRYRATAALMVVDGLCLLLIAVARSGRTRLASWLLIGGLISLITTLALEAGGIRSPGVGAFFVFILMAGLLLGGGAAILTALASGAISLGLVLAELSGVLPRQTVFYGPLSLWLLNGVYACVIIILSRLTAQTIGGALARAATELAERRQVEQRLSMALEAGAIGVWDRDLKTGRFHGDDRAFALFDLPVPPDHEVAQEAWQERVHAANLPGVLTALDELSKGAQQVRTQYRIARGAGEYRDIEAAASTLLDQHGQPSRIVGMIMDVTERRATERERERLVADLGERVKELRLLHAVTRLLQSDRPFNRSVLEELVVHLPRAWMHPECCESRIAYRDIEVTTPGWRESPWRQSAAFTTSDGKGIVEVAYLTGMPMEDEGPFLAEERALIDSLAEMLASYLERDLVESQRRGLEGQLRQSQKMEALGTLAGGIAHDFNNILSAIGGNVELALADTTDGDPARTSLKEIAKASARAADLVKRILLFSRRQDSARTVIHVEPVVEEALGLLRASLPPMIQIQSTYGSGVPAISADASQMHQILMNLGTNAGHAMGVAGGVLSVEVDCTTVGELITAPSADLEPGPHARITVRDTGTGMSPEILERLFEPFFTTKGHAGTGLGLAVVHGIVHDHGGAIVVESEIGRGTTFRIYLPAADAAIVEVQPEATGPAHGNGEHIMYVDDEEALVFLMTRVLKRLSYRCTGFSDPDAALQAFRGNPREFDAVITDMSMPGMSGLELASALAEIRPDVPIAIASGYIQGDADAAMHARIAAHLNKPSSTEELGRVLRGMLG